MIGGSLSGRLLIMRLAASRIKRPRRYTPWSKNRGFLEDSFASCDAITWHPALSTCRAEAPCVQWPETLERHLSRCTIQAHLPSLEEPSNTVLEMISPPARIHPVCSPEHTKVTEDWRSFEWTGYATSVLPRAFYGLGSAPMSMRRR